MKVVKLMVIIIFFAVPVFSQERAAERREWWICPGGETAGYGLTGGAYGGSLALAYGNGASIGLKTVYLFDAGDMLSILELNILLRLYFRGGGSGSGLFIQFTGGPALFFAQDSGIAIPAEWGEISGGVSLGWRFLLGKTFFIEPSIRGGYPYITGGGLSAGFRYAGASRAYLNSRPVQTTPTPALTSIVTTPEEPDPQTMPDSAPQPDLTATRSPYDRGVEFFDQNEWDAAIEEFTEAIRLNPDYTDAFVYRGFAYNNKNDYDSAIADYTEVIRLNPDYAIAYNNRGIAYFDKRDYDRAIEDYTEAIRLNPDYALAYNNRGLVYQKKKNRKMANADFAKARELGYDP